MASVNVQIFQSGEIEAAGRYLHTRRANGEVAAVFLYYKKNDPNAEESVGTLYVGMPDGSGLSKEGHEAIKARYHIAAFEQRNQIAVAITDTEIEEAYELLVFAIRPY